MSQKVPRLRSYTIPKETGRGAVTTLNRAKSFGGDRGQKSSVFMDLGGFLRT